MTTELREATAATLREAAVTEDGRTMLRVIGPGWSANGKYYPADVLKRDGPKVFTEGTHTYIDHPSASESADRPERSLRDLAGSLARPVTWQDDGPAGPGLYAEATVRDAYRPLLDDLAEDIGVSIRAQGLAEPGEAEGRQGVIITELTSAESVDYVTRPAAGGRVLQLIESVRSGHQVVPLAEARNAGQWFESHIHLDFTRIADSLAADGHLTRDERIALSRAIGDALEAFNAAVASEAPHLYDRDPFAEPNPSPTEVSESEPGQGGNAMPEIPEEELAQLREAASRNEDLERQLAEATGGNPPPLSTTRQLMERELEQERTHRALSEARERARQVLGSALAEAWVPPATVSRITESLLGDLPMTDDRQLDESKLIERAQRQLEQAETEMAEAMAAAGVGRPRDLGYRPDDAAAFNGERSAQQLEETFRRLGLSESAAKLAAQGRS